MREYVQGRLLIDIARHEHAWLLRAEGLTLRQIGARLGVSRNQARILIFQFSYRVKRAMRKTRWRVTCSKLT
jgi:DNA-directed RNA polymerase specialized sigma24 family protein